MQDLLIKEFKITVLFTVQYLHNYLSHRPASPCLGSCLTLPQVLPHLASGLSSPCLRSCLLVEPLQGLYHCSPHHTAGLCPTEQCSGPAHNSPSRSITHCNSTSVSSAFK